MFASNRTSGILETQLMASASFVPSSREGLFAQASPRVRISKQVVCIQHATAMMARARNFWCCSHLQPTACLWGGACHMASCWGDGGGVCLQELYSASASFFLTVLPHHVHIINGNKEPHIYTASRGRVFPSLTKKCVHVYENIEYY